MDKQINHLAAIEDVAAASRPDAPPAAECELSPAEVAVGCVIDTPIAVVDEVTEQIAAGCVIDTPPIADE